MSRNKSSSILSTIFVLLSRKAIFFFFFSGEDTSMPPLLYIATTFLASPDSVNVSYLKTYPTNSISSIDIGSGGNYSVADVITEL